jgi:iron(III) transport system substrate-binding protein
MKGRRIAGPVGSVLAMACIALLPACSSSGSKGPSITLYNGQHEQTTDALVSAFEAKTGIHVNVRSDDEDVLAQQIRTEGSDSPADVFYTENSPALAVLDEHKLLAPIEQSTLSAVPGQYSAANGDWVGVSARVSVLVYDTRKLSPSQLPTSVMDLASPQWAGKLALAPSETDFQPIVTSIAKAHGTAAALTWLNAVKHNAAAHIYPDNETITSQVNAGQAEIGIINHYYWYRLRSELGASSMHSAIAYFAPDDPGYVIDVSGAGVLASSKHQAAAQQLVAFLVSQQGEGIIANSDSWEYPVGSGAAANPALRPLASLQPNPISIADLGDGSTAVELLQQAQLL